MPYGRLNLRVSMSTQRNTANEDLALELGAKLVRKDGSIFNAAGRSDVVRLPKRAESTPIKTETSAPPQTNFDGLTKALSDMMEKLHLQQPVINVPEAPAPVVTVQQPQRVLDWTFTFERNGDGTIKSIRAKAT